MSTERWHAVGRWVVEDCAEQPEEPMPLFQCDLPANAVTVANIYNEVCTERDAAVAENARLLARIAAVEATLAAEPGRFGAIREIRDCLGAGPMDYELFVDELDDILAGTSPRVAALAASPTPTGPEPARCEHKRTEAHARDDSDQSRMRWCPGPGGADPKE